MEYSIPFHSEWNAVLTLKICDPGSQVQQAISAFLGTGVPFDGGVEAVADMVVKKVGLKVGQSAAYTITKVAIMEAVQLVGIGAGAATLNTTGFALAQIKATVEDIQRKVGFLLDGPLQEALDYC
jgi:hypothetical protein